MVVTASFAIAKAGSWKTFIRLKRDKLNNLLQLFDKHVHILILGKELELAQLKLRLRRGIFLNVITDISNTNDFVRANIQI